MDNYQYLNQKTELSKESEKLYYPINKNIQIQNLFRGDSNLSKQKGRVYFINNNKKEIHLTSRAKENDLGANGPKMLTMNFPPGFMITDNNTRKTTSHEKNKYIQQNMANNMELNDVGSDNEKIFSSTVKKGFQNNDNRDKNNSNKERRQDPKNVDIFLEKQKFKLFKLNSNENINSNNLTKKSKYYTGSGSSLNGLNSTGNTGNLKSENELNSGRGTSSNEKDKYEMALDLNKTESSDNKNIFNVGTILTKVKSNSNTNINRPFYIFVNSNRENKPFSNLIHNNSNIDSNNNSKDKCSKNNSYDKKNMKVLGISSNYNKLVFNPSSITNQRMIKDGSDSELFPSPINQLHIDNKKFANNSKEFKKLYNHLSYSNININQNNLKKSEKYFYYHNKSENNLKSSSSKDDITSKSKSKTKNKDNNKNHTKTKNDFGKNIRTNFYENLIYQLQNISKKNMNSGFEFDKIILKNFEIKKRQTPDVNKGIIYKIYNGYKYFFDVKHGQIFLLKDVSFNLGKGIIYGMEEWNKKNENNSLYLKVYGHENNSEQKQTTWIIQYPIGGESLNDMINSVGFYDKNILFELVTKIYKSIIKIKENMNDEKYQNIPFCLCDIFININEHIKIIPPLIRNIPLNSITNKDKKTNFHNFSCKCKINLKLLQKVFNINKDNISFFCLGFLIIQIITQNLIFELNSYKNIITNNNSYNKFSSYENNLENKNNCCFVHLLLDNENERLNGNEFLLFSHFLKLYPPSLLTFLHECTSFGDNIPSPSSEFLNLYNTNRDINLTIKEILEITNLPKNEYIKFDKFLSQLEIIYKDQDINYVDFMRKMNHNKAINVLSRSFNMDKDIFLSQINKKIDNNYYSKNNKQNINLNEKENNDNANNFNCNNNCSLFNYSSLFIGHNKKKNNPKNINNNNLGRLKNPKQMYNYRSSENYDYNI
jgi:hypothetical protein